MSTPSDLQAFGREVWDTLYQIDVSPYVEKKGGLDYVSWANAWSLAKNAFPLSTWEPAGENFLDNGTCEVRVVVRITDGTNSLVQGCTLPVMDNRNSAIKNPDTRAINDSRQRCLVKALAMLGLGIKVYGADGLPEAPVTLTGPQQGVQDLIEQGAIKPGMIERRFDGRGVSQLTDDEAKAVITKMMAKVASDMAAPADQEAA
jgi:hypothetical protein